MTATLAPVTQERIEAVLDALGLKHFRGEDGQTHTAFPELVCFFQVADVGFKATTRWMATARDDKDIQTLRLMANDLNRAMPLVRTHPMVREDGTAIALVEAPFFAAPGVSDEQLRAMIEYYFSAIHHVKAQLGGQLAHIIDPRPESEA